MEELEQLIELKRKQGERPALVIGKAVDVSGDKCTVKREGKPDLLDVRLDAILGVGSDFIRITPKEGSLVSCLVIEGNHADVTIVKYSQVEKMEAKLAGAEFIIKDGKFSMKNTAGDLGKILSDGFKQLRDATVLTPSGPGQLSPADKVVLTQQLQKLSQLFI